MREIAVVTGSRSDFGILLPVLRAIEEHASLRLRLIVTGMHLSPEFGSTIDEINEAGFHEYEKVDMLLSSGTEEGIGKSIGLAVTGFSQLFAAKKPDLLVLLGDRFETLAAATAALPFNIPIAHIHGGEVTEGAFDDAIRHALTKFSHLHFVATESFAKRIIKMGEEEWRVTVSGAPALDNLREFEPYSDSEMNERFGLKNLDRFILVTFHPETKISSDENIVQLNELLKALKESDYPVTMTSPNADPLGNVFLQRMKEFVDMDDKYQIVSSLGTKGYFTLMTKALCMLGNSSSGIIEAASFKLPVVNIGDRQKNRLTPDNVVSVKCDSDQISKTITKCVSEEFVEKIKNLINPYGNGSASEVIVKQLAEVSLDSEFSIKKFVD